MNEWQPIETAPDDGTVVIVFEKGEVFTAYGKRFERGVYWWEAYSQGIEVSPTHWMPLPEPPTMAQNPTHGAARKPRTDVND